MAFFFMLYGACTLHAQLLPDSIHINTKIYAVANNGSDIFQSEYGTTLLKGKSSYTIKGTGKTISKKKIESLIGASSERMSFEEHFKNTGIDTLTIKNRTRQLLNDDFEWTPLQADYILPLLHDINYYRRLYEEGFYANGDFNIGTSHYRFKKKFHITIYTKNQIAGFGTTTSVSGCALPYTTNDGTENYNPKLKKHWRLYCK
ncbi:hypothetical protein GR160_07365 [Flavobacterium sp. Sd200]|nr:hypothetical protein [Flavobacterium sp. Sd200]